MAVSMWIVFEQFVSETDDPGFLATIIAFPPARLVESLFNGRKVARPAFAVQASELLQRLPHRNRQQPRS